MAEQMTSQTDEPSVPTEDSGFWNKFINIFVNPQKAFEVLDRRPTWLVPMLIVIVLVLITTQLTFPLLMEAQLDRFKENPDISREQMELIRQQLSENMNTQRIFAAIAQVVFMPILYLFLAGIFYFAGSVILGGDSTYKKVLSVYSWSGLISLLGSIVVTALIMIKGSTGFSLSPAILLPPEAVNTTLHTLLSKFDLFTIWFLAVFGYGFAMIFRFSLAKAYIAIGILWGIYIAISTIFADVFRNFGL
jgi:hypothetical protein